MIKELAHLLPLIGRDKKLSTQWDNSYGPYGLCPGRPSKDFYRVVLLDCLLGDLNSRTRQRLPYPPPEFNCLHLSNSLRRRYGRENIDTVTPTNRLGVYRRVLYKGWPFKAVV